MQSDLELLISSTNNFLNNAEKPREGYSRKFSITDEIGQEKIKRLYKTQIINLIAATKAEISSSCNIS